MLLVVIREVNMLYYPSQYPACNGYHVNTCWFIHTTTLDGGPATWASFYHRKTDTAGSHDWNELRPQSFNTLSSRTSKSIDFLFFFCYLKQSMLFFRASRFWGGARGEDAVKNLIWLDTYSWQLLNISWTPHVYRNLY